MKKIIIALILFFVGVIFFGMGLGFGLNGDKLLWLGSWAVGAVLLLFSGTVFADYKRGLKK